MLPDSLYQQFRSYKQGVMPQQYFATKWANGTSYTISGELDPVPEEYDLLISSMCLFLMAGSGQVAVFADISVKPFGSAGSNHFKIAGRTFDTAFIENYVNFSGSLLVPAGSIVAFSATFDSPTISNDTFLYVTGQLIPKLNI